MRFKTFIIFGVFVGVGLAGLSSAWAAGKKAPVQPTPTPIPGKKMVELDHVEQVHIELPNNQFRDFGSDFQARLTTLLSQSGKFLVTDPSEGVSAQAQMSALSSSPGFVWNGTFVPAAAIKINVSAMSFVAGSRGSRMFYGFDDRMRSKYNDGSGSMGNEFPISDDAFATGWFDSMFDDEGNAPFDSRSGLDLGDQFSIDLLLGWLTVNHSDYRADLKLEVTIDSAFLGFHEIQPIQVQGTGFYFDVAGGYEGYTLGMRYARTDALLQAFQNAIDAIEPVLERELAKVPLMARLDHIVTDSTGTWYLLGTGHDAAIQLGVQYSPLGDSSTVLQVVQSFSYGSVAQLVSGNAGALIDGAILEESQAVSAVRSLASTVSALSTPQATDIIIIPPTDFPVAAFPNPPAGVSSARWQDFLSNVIETVFLPYRIWRYFQYDQDYLGSTQALNSNSKVLSVGPAEPGVMPAGIEEQALAQELTHVPAQLQARVQSNLMTAQNWTDSAHAQPWAHQIGLDVLPASSGGAITDCCNH